MKGAFLKLGCAATVLAAMSIPSLRAAEGLPDQSLSDYKIGETVLGDEVKEEDLAGKVVVIEYWGTR
jgi:hypothetical protein